MPAAARDAGDVGRTHRVRPHRRGHDGGRGIRIPPAEAGGLAHRRDGAPSSSPRARRAPPGVSAGSTSIASRGRAVRRFPDLFSGTTERPLAAVVAVQLIQGDWHKIKGNPAAGQPGRSYFTYQVNLVQDDEDEPRVNLTNHAHWEASYETAASLAEFLDVPLWDEASEGDASEKA